MNCSNLAPTDGIIWGMNIDLDRHDTITDMLQRIQWDRAPGAYGMFIKLTDRIIGQTPLDVLKKEDLDDFLQQIRGTNAIFVVSCDPIEGYAAVTDEAINQFAAKMAEYNQYGIPVLIRPAHEMNGPWYAWGQQPTGYIAFHRKLFTAVRRVAPQTQFVFAPNLGVGYPWPGGGWNYSITASSPDYSILDTNKDGSVNELDDPYTPYWPGDDYVQWFGVSIYWKGNYPYTENLEVPPNLITRQLTTVLGGGLSTYQFAERRNLPIVIPEMAGSYGIGNPGVSRTLVKQGFWQQVFGNEAHAAFPLLKMALWFDYLKFEDRALRDFTLTNTTTFAEIGSLFKADFQSYPHVLYASNLTLSSNNNEQCGCFKYNAERKALEASAVGGGSNASSNSGNGGAGADAGKDGAATGGRATNGVVGGSGMGVSGLVGVVTAVVGAVGLGLVW
ncbi:hypothetical protein HK102_005379 [Quaeritorhiza haematococci]|nr:hypothetical protein HK102_005379 [Quaeritorhiza haematococci]